jgi:integrase
MNFDVTARVLPFIQLKEQRMLYSDLHLELVNSDSVSPQTARNMKSTLNAWVEFHKLDLDCPVGPELNTLFSSALERFRDFLIKSGSKEKRAADRLTLMRGWHRLFKEQRPAQQAQTTFAAALSDAVEQSECTRKSISLSVGIRELTLREWLRGNRMPENNHRAVTIPALEKVLKLPTGELSSLLPPPIKKTENAVKTSYQKSLSENLGRPYALKEVPQDLKDEWQDYVRFKTAPLCPGLRKASHWRLRPADTVGRDYPWYARLGSEVCPSAHVAWQTMANVLGFLTKELSEKEQNDGQENISLASLADVSIYQPFVQHMYNRSGAYSNGILNAVAQIKAMVRPNFGYLWQRSEFFAKRYHKGEVSADEFRAMCEDVHLHLIELYKYLSSPNVHKKSREPEEAIRTILERESPAEALYELIYKMELAAPPKSKVLEYAVYLRSALLIRMLVAAPARINNYATMTYAADNTGQLYYSDGSWFIRFPGPLVKNYLTYNVRLPEAMYGMLEEYIVKYRKVLGGAESKYFFRNKMRSNGRGPDLPVTIEHLNSEVTKITRRYISGTPGFGPHAFRHILATDLLMKNPGHYADAAALLNDTVETVIKNYIHLNNRGMRDSYNKYAEKIEKSVRDRMKQSGARISAI